MSIVEEHLSLGSPDEEILAVGTCRDIVHVSGNLREPQDGSAGSHVENNDAGAYFDVDNRAIIREIRGMVTAYEICTRAFHPRCGIVKDGRAWAEGNTDNVAVS